MINSSQPHILQCRTHISSDLMLVLSQGWFSKSDSLTAKGKLSTKSSLVSLLTILRSSGCSAELGFASGRDIEARKEIRGTPSALKYLKSEIHWHDTMMLFHSTNSFQRGFIMQCVTTSMLSVVPSHFTEDRNRGKWRRFNSSFMLGVVHRDATYVSAFAVVLSK